MTKGVEGIAAVLLITENLKKQVELYREHVGIPLTEEQHGEAYLHYGCDLNGIHFAIHPTGNFKELDKVGHGSVRIALNTKDIHALHERLVRRDIEIVFEPRDLGWCQMMAFKDLDGNVVEVVEMRTKG